jgi:hypothetical protein
MATWWRSIVGSIVIAGMAVVYVDAQGPAAVPGRSASGQAVKTATKWTVPRTP